MAWITVIAPRDADGPLKELYRRVEGAGGAVDNILTAHSLRAHTLKGHMALYKSVLHHTANRLPKAYLEAVGVYVSALNRCAYCVEHHAAGLARLLGDDARAAAIRAALDADRPQDAFAGRELAGLGYARKLTRDPASVAVADIAALRAAGFDDGEILEINQVAAYFAYANRMVLGLGVNAEGETLGLSPSAGDDPDDWSHR